MDSLNHWRYFLSLERELCEGLRYVEFTEKQQDVYSFEFARLLILICSELDVVFKVACESINKAVKADSIGSYCTCLSAKYQVDSEVVRIDRFSLIVRPFEHWSKDTPPDWWTAQNKVKHHRHEHFDKATLRNTLHSLCGLFVANLLVLNELDLLDKVHEVPVLLGRDSEPSHFLLEDSYQVNQR